MYEEHKSDPSLPIPNKYSVQKRLDAVKRTEHPWMLEVTKCAPQASIRQLGRAFDNFFSGRARYPRLKKKGKCRDSFSFTSAYFSIDKKRVRIPKLGWVRMREELRLEGTLERATVSRTADRWFISVLVDEGFIAPPLKPGQKTVGMDVGISSLVTLSTGEKIPASNAHKRALKKLRRQSQEWSRRKEGSKNQKKTQMRLSRTHARIANQRADVLHKLSSRLTNEFDVIAREDLNVAGMAKNRPLARAIYDAAFNELFRQVDYKGERKGVRVVVVDRWFASSKLCHKCGVKNQDLTLRQRTWECAHCKERHDRDVNAALNLAAWETKWKEIEETAAGLSVAACGEESAVLGRSRSEEKLASVKQELDILNNHDCQT